MTAAGAVSRDLALRTLDVLLLLATPSGHLAQRVQNESRGNCLPPGHCTPQCEAWKAAFVEWAEILEALDAAHEQPRQLGLLDDGDAERRVAG